MPSDTPLMLATGGTAPMRIPFMPAGEHLITASVNGEPGTRRVVVDAATCARLNADLAAKLEAAAAHQKARPVIYFDHERGDAAAFPARFVWDDTDGIMLELAAWSDIGRSKVEGRSYGYVSPCFKLSRSDGQVLGLPDGVEVASLVNDPAFERIAPIMDERIAAARATLPAGVDIIGAASDCRAQEPARCRVHGSPASNISASLEKAVETVQKVVSRVREKTQGAMSKEELRNKMPGGKIGPLFSSEKVIIMPVSENIVAAVKKEIGRDVNNYHHSITEQSIWHAYSEHCDDSKNTRFANQIDLNWKDFEKLPDILENYDSLEVYSYKTKQSDSVLIYQKEYKDDAYTVIQRIGREKRHEKSTLNFVTEWVTKTTAPKARGRGLSPLYAPPKGSAPDGVKGSRLSLAPEEEQAMSARGSCVIEENSLNVKNDSLIIKNILDLLYGSPVRENLESGKPIFNKNDEFGMSITPEEVESSRRPLLRQAQMVPATTPNADIIKKESADVKTKTDCIAKTTGKEPKSGETPHLSPNTNLEELQKGADNADTAPKPGGHTPMIDKIKTKLGLHEDATDEAVLAALDKLKSDRDTSQKKAAEVEAENKKKDDELKAAREVIAANKAEEAARFTNDLVTRGVLAPKDEEIIPAARALFESSPENARKVFERIAASRSASGDPIIQPRAPEPTAGGKRVEDFIHFNN